MDVDRFDDDGAAVERSNGLLGITGEWIVDLADHEEPKLPHKDYTAVSGQPRPMDANHRVPGDTPCECGGIAWYHGCDGVGCDDCECESFRPVIHGARLAAWTIHLSTGEKSAAYASVPERSPVGIQRFDDGTCCECGKLTHTCADCKAFGGPGVTPGFPAVSGLRFVDLPEGRFIEQEES
jgi:hypothetical protein